METQVQTHVAERSLGSRSSKSDLECYLDAIADATEVFRSAVEVYLRSGPDGSCWQHAKRMSEHLRTVEDLQQRLETALPAGSLLGGLVADMVEPLIGVGRLIKDMKRQITGFAIESGFSGPGRRVPAYLVPAVRDLSDDVCAAVEALVVAYRQSAVWSEQTSTGEEERRVAWYESQADRRSMELIQKIFSDEDLEVKMKLSLAQFVEEIDRVADYAECVDRELRHKHFDTVQRARCKDRH
ncbi:hypothetical protein [Accumulibacter sp.]|uniref:hypothetical protein n=1 Tax=Accumulibacter sp. TaxID=2053492 RepID=UPI002631B9B6|nr:hypothetical protein [Accumulibacter sp.]